jgi:hypothetical protein
LRQVLLGKGTPDNQKINAESYALTERNESMRVISLIGLGIAMSAALLSGCGGGGSGGGGGSSASEATVIGGMVSKGPVKAGTVTVYAIRNGTEDRSAPIGQGQTDDGGNYTISVGSYKGPVVVEATGGSYNDEVSGTPVNLKAPLRTALANASTGMNTVSITPLTELAYRKAKGATFTSASINDANTTVTAMFSLSDIISTLPLASGDSDQKKYAAVCGSFSQLVNDSKAAGESLDNATQRVMTDLGNEEEQKGGLSIDSITKINDAITRFNNSSTGSSAIVPIPTPTGGLLKISSAGSAGAIGAIDVTVILPAGVKVNADAATGEAAAEVVTVSGVAATSANKLVAAKFTPAAGGTPGQLHILLISSEGFGPGEFATVRFEVEGGTFPKVDAFSVTGFTARGLTGSELKGISALPASVSTDF